VYSKRVYQDEEVFKIGIVQAGEPTRHPEERTN